MSDHDHDPEIPPLPQRLIDAAEGGCEESRLFINRRNVLGLSAGFFAWAHLPRHAEAAGTEPRLLVVIMRGGMDGLHVAVPLWDQNYVSLRGKIALDASALLSLQSTFSTQTVPFGLNPAMPKFQRMFLRGEAAMVNAIAPPLQVSSHFEGLYNIEAGLPGVGARSSNTGWLNRLLMELPAGAAVKSDALHIGATPLILAGPAPVLSWSPDIPALPQAFDDRISRLYKSTSPLLSDLLERGLAANRLATAGSNAASQVAGVTALQKAFRGAARLMTADNGPRIAALSVDGWDTHVGQVSVLSSKLGALDTALDDFRVEMGAAWDNTAVVCVTEMGRTVAVNGNDGTDHGVASVAFLAGGAIAGGKVLGDWPGLGPSGLVNGRALRATTDMRSVFKGLLQDHLGVPRSLLDSKIFPQSADTAPMKDMLKTPSRAAAVATLSANAASMRSATKSTPAAAAAASPARYDTALARFRKINGSS